MSAFPATCLSCVAGAMLALSSCGEQHPSADRAPLPPVRVAVVANMLSSGLWDEVSDRFTAVTGWPVEVVLSGEREQVAAALGAGWCDLATLHEGEITRALVADHAGMHSRPWAVSEMVIVGPQADPAGVRGLRDGAEALRRIALTQSPFLTPEGTGSLEMAAALWKKVGITPQGPWVLPASPAANMHGKGTGGGNGNGTGGGNGGGGGKGSRLEAAAAEGAYAISGRISAEKAAAAVGGRLEILVSGDPAMIRPFVVIEATPQARPHGNPAGARALADFLVSPAAQALLRAFKPTGAAGVWFMPVAAP